MQRIFEKIDISSVEIDEIESIEELGEEETMDIEIDSEDHLFFANGILTHNSEFDASDLTISSASESSGLAATVDGMFGIIQDPIMYSNKEYKLKVIANRDEGYKNSYKRFLVDYGFMRIMEDPNSEIMSDNG